MQIPLEPITPSDSRLKDLGSPVTRMMVAELACIISEYWDKELLPGEYEHTWYNLRNVNESRKENVNDNG